MLAAYDLQSRLFGFVQYGLLSYAGDETKKDLIYTYTAFLVGQYLSWTYILRRQAQFLRFSTDKTNKRLNAILDDITNQFSLDRHKGEDPFMLWRGQQMAIGELMTKSEDNDQLYCMGFGAFAIKYAAEPDFKKWFEPIEAGVHSLVEAQARRNFVANYRLRRLQHLLIDLVLLLDPEYATSGPNKQLKVDAALECKCDKCPGEKLKEVVAPSKLPEP